ncbi:poly(A)-specific ribonuclease PARN isoform X2 [Anoplophora glabripennis]|uniref:poly(A)-specific ribonuclease PARN isoform X2 n=1 Tax=Anoplophora glabripennis TaxID=217634 RepID=UPI00087436E0|nr:poly(A)-specific ribonuclease PARN isoform X2 [Anoplophora glabripennis]
MEVTASNFKTVLPDVEKTINDCTFLSVDCELTGLDLVRNINTFDTPGQYYGKLRSNCKEFLVIQYGLSMFRYDEEKDVFKNHTYNFYIFRRPINRNVPDQRFLCQTSSINFLIHEGFDFNKLFKEGISYLNIVEEEIYRGNLEEAYKKRTESIQSHQNETNDIIPIPEDARQFVDDVVQQIETFLESDEVELQLPKCNSFLRRLVYQTKAEKFADKITLETRQVENKDRILFVRRLRTREEEEEIEKQKYEEQIGELEDFVGFTKVLRMIVNSGKLIIGHNLCLDLLHTLDKFLNPLPDDYVEFKELAHSLFPKILDTKYMSSLEPFKELIQSNVLKHLLDAVSEKPFEIPNVEFEQNQPGYNLNDGKEHEAGYDAYITGLSFLSMWKYLGTSVSMKNEDIFCDFQLLRPYINKIFLMLLVDNQYINLAGKDLTVSRDHVFYMTFPKEWKTGNITQLFSPFGKVYVSWLDETSAYVSLYERDQAAMALSTLSQGEAYTMTTFARRQATLLGIKTPLPSPVPKKRRSVEGQPAAKRRKTDSFNSGSFSTSKRSIDPIIEEELAETEENVSSKKIFMENDVWG